MIGSSTAEGEGASSIESAWVSLLEVELAARLTGSFELFNLAVGGYTSATLLPDSGVSGNLLDALDTEPDLIVVALSGSNDLSAGTSTETFMTRMQSLREAALDASVPLFFVSPAPKDLDLDERQMLRDWTLIMADLFTSCTVPGRSEPHAPCFVDIFEPLATESLNIAPEYNVDGIHVNDEGHAQIYVAAEAVIAPYVCSQRECR